MTSRASFFDPWLTINGGDNIFASAIGEAAGKTGKRGRWKEGATNREAIARAVLANLTRVAVRSAEASAARMVIVPLGKQREGGRKVHSRPGFAQLPLVLGRLRSVGLLKINKPKRARIIESRYSRAGARADDGERYATTIKPSTKFMRMVRAAGITASDIVRNSSEARTIWVINSTVLWHRGGRRERHRAPAPDTAEARRLHAQLQPINAALAPYNGGLPLWRGFHDPELRTGGRLYDCGAWQNLKQSQRHTLRIGDPAKPGGGEPVAIVDFVSMFPRLAYVAIGQQPPDGDLYAELPGQRDGIKKVLNGMLFRDTPLRKFPRGTRKFFPSDVSAAEVRAAIIRKHRALAPIFETGIGLRLMRIESDILVTVLLDLLAAGIVGLPLHDSVIVKRSAAYTAARIMEEAARRETGFPLPVKISRPHSPGDGQIRRDCENLLT